MAKQEIRGFTEYAVDTHLGERRLARMLTEDEGRLEDAPVCVVSHPDAGGACGKPAACEVYGLPFCGLHGLEANYGCLNQVYSLALDELSDMRSEGLCPATLEHLDAGWRRFNGLTNSFSDAHSRQAKEAFAHLEGRVDAETLEWDYEDPTETPPDWWLEAYWKLCRFMYEAWRSRRYFVCGELEPLRERAAAQYAFAEKVFRERTPQTRTVPADAGA